MHDDTIMNELASTTLADGHATSRVDGSRVCMINDDVRQG